MCYYSGFLIIALFWFNLLQAEFKCSTPMLFLLQLSVIYWLLFLCIQCFCMLHHDGTILGLCCTVCADDTDFTLQLLLWNQFVVLYKYSIFTLIQDDNLFLNHYLKNWGLPCNCSQSETCYVEVFTWKLKIIGGCHIMCRDVLHSGQYGIQSCSFICIRHSFFLWHFFARCPRVYCVFHITFTDHLPCLCYHFLVHTSQHVYASDIMICRMFILSAFLKICWLF